MALPARGLAGLGGGLAYDWKRGWPWASLAKDRAQELGGTLAEKVKERLKPARAAHGSYVEHRTDTCSYNAPLHVAPQPLCSPLSSPCTEASGASTASVAAPHDGNDPPQAVPAPLVLGAPE